MRYVVQTSAGKRYIELFDLAVEAGPFEELSCAVAYATVGGVRMLEQTLEPRLGEAWARIRKRWLVGIDWCRSDPPALRRLAAIANSQVRIPNGRSLLASAGCTPRDTFHPKLFIFAAPSAYAVICGSGNLSANGLSRGCEVGGLLVVNRALDDDASNAEQVAALLQWLRNAWRQADSYRSLAEAYESICRNRIRTRHIVPTEDDNRPPEETGPGIGRALTEEQIRELRTFDNFWIDAGALGANLGAGVPGNQLDMKRFTRAFFGAAIDNLAPNEEIDHITLIWDGEEHPDRTLKFGHNYGSPQKNCNM